MLLTIIQLSSWYQQKVMTELMEHPVNRLLHLHSTISWRGKIGCTRESRFTQLGREGYRSCAGGGLPYMTSAVCGGGGSTKKQTKGTKSADLWQWQGRGCKKMRKFCGHHIWKPPRYEKCDLNKRKQVDQFKFWFDQKNRMAVCMNSKVRKGGEYHNITFECNIRKIHQKP